MMASQGGEPLEVLPLSTMNLSLFTQLHPANARSTVKLHLHDQRDRTYPIKELENTSTPTPSIHPVPPLALRPGAPDPAAVNNTDTALILHQDDEPEGSNSWKPKGDDFGAGERKRDRDAEAEPPRKRASVVAAMRGRNSSQPIGSEVPTRGVPGNVRSSGKGQKERVEDRTLLRPSSPILVARAEAREAKEAQEARVEMSEKKKGKQREEDLLSEKQEPNAKRKTKTSGAVPAKTTTHRDSRRMEGTFESDEDEEHVARLEARRQRRLAKALIVKDRTQSATTTGQAAASKLKSASKSRAKEEKKKKKRDEDGSEDVESSVDSRSAGRKKRKVSTAETNKLLQNTQKAPNVSGSRLTIRPAIKLGFFHKGAASARTKTKIGTKLPDLAFSELSFLNAPRRKPPSSDDSSSSPSSSSSDPESLAPKKQRKPTRKGDALQTVITYGKRKRRSKHASKYFEEEEPKAAQPRAPSPRKSKRKAALETSEASSPPRPRKPDKEKGRSKPHKKPPSPKASRFVIPPSPPPRPSEHSSQQPAPSVAHERSSQHSAHSLAQRRISPSSSLERVQPEPFIDTSNLWPFQAPNARREPTPSATLSYRAASPSSSNIDLERLIEACLEGRLPSLTNYRIEEDREPAGPAEQARSWVAESQVEENELGWISSQAQEAENLDVETMQDGFMGHPTLFDHDFDASFDVAHSPEIGRGQGRKDSDFYFDNNDGVPDPFGNFRRAMDYRPPSLFDDDGHQGAPSVGSWQTRSYASFDRASETGDVVGGWDTSWNAPGGIARTVSRNRVVQHEREEFGGASRTPDAFGFTPAFSRLRQDTETSGRGEVETTDTSAFRRAMTSHWYRSKP
ncbi:hypothetical protein P7C70_g3321, partial [Phenoliferia sp. Uapishka_3]